MEQQALLLRTVEILDKLRIPYMVTGSFAVNFYGIPRISHDIDFVIQIDPADAIRFPPEFPADWYVDSEMIRRAAEQLSTFNVIDPSSGLKIDFWILTGNPFDIERFHRRRSQPLFGHMLWMPSPEDVILSKLLWYKEAQTDKHLNDVRGVWDMQKELIDGAYLKLWAARLSVENLLEQLEKP